MLRYIDYQYLQEFTKLSNPHEKLKFSIYGPDFRG